MLVQPLQAPGERSSITFERNIRFTGITFYLSVLTGFKNIDNRQVRSFRS